MTDDDPTPASAATAVVLTVLGLGILAWYVGVWRPLLAAVVTGGTFGLGGLVATRDNPGSTAVASGLYVVTTGAAILTVVELGGGSVTSGPLVFVLASTVAAFGAVTLPRQSRVVDAVRSNLVIGGAVVAVLWAVPLVGVGIYLLTGNSATEGIRWVVGLVDGPSRATPAPGSLLVTLAVATFAASRLYRRLPVPELADREHREEVRDRVDRTARVAGRASAAVAALGGVLVAVPTRVWAGPLQDGVPPVHDLLVAVTTAGVLRHALIWVTATSVAGLVAIGVARRARSELLTRVAVRAFGGVLIVVLAGAVHLVRPAVFRGVTEEVDPATAFDALAFDSTASLLVAMAAIGVCAVGISAAAIWLYQDDPTGPLVILALVISNLAVGLAVASRFEILTPRTIVDRATEATTAMSPVAFVLALAAVIWTAVCLALVIAIGLAILTGIPRRTAGAVIAGGGLGMATIGARIAESGSPVLFVTMALALVVWDAGSYGQSLGRELGRNARTRRVELVHVGATAAVAGLGALGVYALLAAALRLEPTVVAPAAIVSLLGALVLLSLLRG